LKYGEKGILDDQEWKVATSNGAIELKKSWAGVDSYFVAVFIDRDRCVKTKNP
jgi:hypothetical protein